MFWPPCYYLILMTDKLSQPFKSNKKFVLITTALSTNINRSPHDQKRHKNIKQVARECYKYSSTQAIKFKFKTKHPSLNARMKYNSRFKDTSSNNLDVQDKFKIIVRGNNINSRLRYQNP